ncbi:DNA and RNA helicase [Paenibacillus hunanensis]|uniref:DNA and RNA helicase n=1 Tax=Paenibacillus hunanensis TaxID=539262 RepID=UPI002A6A8727|nr:DNA and RNA helicase [Paenibacillus hunanensis]WPP42969.1 DNA and RNA helicase [Paenibacillus hunanensis]
MFTYIQPRFEKGRVLKTEMLEQVRDYPRVLANIEYDEYSDGILSGAHVTVDPAELIVAPGLVKFRGHLYMLEQSQRLFYEATENEQILRIRFEDNGSDRDFERLAGMLILDEQQPSADELELGRFKLKQGAVLRSDYIDFADMVTEFNTWNPVSACYAGIGQCTLRPEVIHRFARELLQTGTQEAADYAFAFMALNTQRVERTVLEHYIAARNQTELVSGSNMKLHRQLTVILQDAARGKRSSSRWGNRSPGGRMIVD